MGTDTLSPTPAPLTKADRCDRCGAQAFVRAVMPGGHDLVFCVHHGRRYEQPLRDAAVTVLDQSGEVNPTARPPATA